MLTLDTTYAKPFLDPVTFSAMKAEATEARRALMHGELPGAEATGWIDLPFHYDQSEFARIKETAARIQHDAKVLLVIGIGGSYLGAKAAIDFLTHHFRNQVTKATEIYFVGHQLSAAYMLDLLAVIGDRDFAINIISKSGTTTEPAIAFRFFRKILEDRYGAEGANQRIFATTDRTKGALKHLADARGWETFVVPDDIGGRYSVLTAVGLLPIAVAGGDIDALMAGAANMATLLQTADFDDNPALQYAALRQYFYRTGKSVEILGNYEPRLHSLGEWWKQLFGESEGKNHRGLFPAAYDLTTDLHSLGQYIQDGQRLFIETILHLEAPSADMNMIVDPDDGDGLNYLAGKTLVEVNACAMNGTTLAHVDGGVPNLRIILAKQDAENLGELFYFFEFACGVSGTLLRVNPFNQPGVEDYKRNMFALLGKPGTEERRAELLARQTQS